MFSHVCFFQVKLTIVMMSNWIRLNARIVCNKRTVQADRLIANGQDMIIETDLTRPGMLVSWMFFGCVLSDLCGYHSVATVTLHVCVCVCVCVCV